MEHRRLIVINGPTGIARGFVSDAMRSFVQINAAWMKPMVMQVDEPLKKGAHALYCAFHGADFYSGEGRKDADVTCGDFLGMTPNQTYLEMYKTLEDLHGPEALGYITRKRIVRNSFAGVVILDCSDRIGDVVPSVGLIGEQSTLVVELQGVSESLGEKLKLIFPKITLKKLPCKMYSRTDRELMKVLAQGTIKGFLDIEEKEDA